MLPPDESDQIVLVIAEAFAYGAEGRVPKGYLLLAENLREAQRQRHSLNAEALRLWETALQRFKERFPTEWYPDQSV